MESMFQNCVSEFDLNLFEQATNVNQATPLKPCPEAQQLGIARLKGKVKRLSQVVHRAKHIDEVLLVLEKELLETEQELKDTKSLLAEKIEENKVICEERTTYFNQVAEYTTEVNTLKEHLEKVKDKDYDSKLKDRIINGYSNQVNGLQKELDDLMIDKKQKEKNATVALKQAKSGKALVEKKLVRLLKEYVLPTNKKRDRWLHTIIKRYITAAHEEEKDNKIEKPEETAEKEDEVIIDEEEPSTQPIRNISVDFDYVESVDTGRGSSLAFSDGEKSFHSPDYYMGDSPSSTVSNICSKCNVPRSDASTSPISPESSGNTDDSDSDIGKKIIVSKKDACTSPIPLQRHDVAINTSNVSIEVINPTNDVLKIDVTDSEENNTHTHTIDKKENASGYNEVLFEDAGVSHKKSDYIPSKLQDFTFDTDDEDIVSGGSGNASPVYSPVNELSTSAAVPFDKIVNSSQIISGKEVYTAVVKTLNNIEYDTDGNADECLENVSKEQSHIGESPIITPRSIEAASTDHSEKETLLISLKQQDNTESDSDDEVMHNASPIKSHVFSPIDSNVSESKCNNAVTNEPPEIQTKPQQPSDSEINTNRNTLQELKCLEINNSKHCNDDVEIDSEIRKILGKMRLRHKIITPIPATPAIHQIPQNKLPVENQNVIFSQQAPKRQLPVENQIIFSQEAQVITETINEQINILRTKVQEVFTPFVETMPHCLEQISRLFSRGDLNEELLRNLLHDPNKSYEKHKPEFPSYNSHAESNNGLQPNVVDLNTDSMLCLAETGENESSACNDYTIIEEDSQSEYQISHIENDNTQRDETCRPNEVLPHVANNKLPNASLLKSEKREKSDCVSTANMEAATDDNFNANDDIQTQLCNITRNTFSDYIEYGNNALASIVSTNPATTLTAIESRNSIAYEGGDVSDDEDDLGLSVSLDSMEGHNEDLGRILRRKGKMKKKTKLESLRLRMLPKSKIKSNNETKTVRKLRSRPIPINTVPKKKVKESDTAASLNDKSVYENAVKVIAALKSQNELRVIVDDCQLYTPYKTRTRSAKNNCENRHIIELTKTQSPAKVNNVNKKRKLSENHTPDSNEQTSSINTKKGKRTSVSLDENMSNKSTKTTKQKGNDIAPRKLSCEISDPLTTKRTHEIVNSSTETKELTRKRIIDAEHQTSPRYSQYEDDVIEQECPRMLRSSLHGKPNKENNLQDEPIVAETTERLRSKSYQMKSDTKTDVVSIGRKPRIARQSTRQRSESTQDVHTVSDTMSRKENNRDASYADLSLDSNGDTQNQTVDKNNLEIHNTRSEFDRMKPDAKTNVIAIDKKPRIARQATLKGSENKQDKKHRSTASDIITRKERNISVSYSDLNEDTQNQPADKNNIDVGDYTLGRKPRIARKKPRIGPKNTKDSSGSDVSIRNNDRVVSYADLNLFSNEDNQDQTMENNRIEIDSASIVTRDQTDDRNNLERDDSTAILSLGRKTRLASKNEHRVSESTKDTHSSTLPAIFKKDKGIAVSNSNLNLPCEKYQGQTATSDMYRKDSLLCRTIQTCGVQKIKFVAKQPPEAKVKDICEKLETRLTEILEVPHGEISNAMRKLVVEIRAWNVKHFIYGFIMFLKNPERKIELYSKSICPPFPPMTKKEQVLLYVFDELQKSYDYRNIVKKILMNIEYTLFAINKSAESFEVIETMAHFYALLCRSYQKISQLRLFIIDAMYCLQLRSVILVQQCLEVWMSVLPLGHMGLAKCPLVTCLVYLLHFYKCEDRFNRVQDIRNTLRWKYNYDMADWNENKMLDVFKTAIVEIRDSPMERKMLRLSLLILAKRHGAKWCHNNFVKNMLQPLISDSRTSERARRFCVSLLGPLLKPYPAAMKVHCEMVIDYLMDMLHRKNSQKMQEAILSSLLYVDKNNNRLHQFLAKWSPKEVSPEFNVIFRDYVRSKSVHNWKQILSWPAF